MKRAKQFGVLTLMLIFPVFVIWFLRAFGENKYTIPVFHQNAAEMSSDLCVFPEGQHHIPPFSLTNQENRKVTQAYFDDHITVVNFFFTTCPTICPIMTSELSRIQASFNTNPRVRLLSISVDPEYDTPEVLASYANIHDANPRQWNFVRGDKESTYELVRCGFILPVQERQEAALDILHTDRMVLVDSQGRIRGYYSGTEPEEVERLITEMKILLQEENF